MKKNYNFYAIADSNGITTIKSDKYNTLKALFSDKNEAYSVVERYSDLNLRVVRVSIVEVK